MPAAAAPPTVPDRDPLAPPLDGRSSGRPGTGPPSTPEGGPTAVGGSPTPLADSVGAPPTEAPSLRGLRPERAEPAAAPEARPPCASCASCASWAFCARRCFPALESSTASEGGPDVPSTSSVGGPLRDAPSGAASGASSSDRRASSGTGAGPSTASVAGPGVSPTTSVGGPADSPATSVGRWGGGGSWLFSLSGSSGCRDVGCSATGLPPDRTPPRSHCASTIVRQHHRVRRLASQGAQLAGAAASPPGAPPGGTAARDRAITRPHPNGGLHSDGGPVPKHESPRRRVRRRGRLRPSAPTRPARPARPARCASAPGGRGRRSELSLRCGAGSRRRSGPRSSRPARRP